MARSAIFKQANTRSQRGAIVARTSDESTGAKIGRYAIAAIAVAFGVMTLNSGGSVLFGSDAARQAAGDYVPFVVWFNFLAGFAYIAGGVGIGLRKWWGAWLAGALAASSAVIFAALGIHIWTGGAYEMRTVGAMTLRTGLWTVFGLASWRLIIHPLEDER